MSTEPLHFAEHGTILMAGGGAVQIKMYNCYFGDCFQLYEQDCMDDSLLVDFGIHRKSKLPAGETIDSRLCRLKNEICSKSLGAALLTHFHQDHYNGFFHVAATGHRFHTLYLPDIFHLSSSRICLSLLMLEELFQECYLSKSGGNLLSFVRLVCGSADRVQFLSRGTSFRSFQALWPDLGYLDKQCSTVFQHIELGPDVESLLPVADELLYFVSEKAELGGNFSMERHQTEFSRLEGLLTAQQHDLQTRIKRGEHEEAKWLLNRFSNDISIVFQNAVSCAENLLFTGDISPEYMSTIYQNADHRIPLHQNYKYIKVPHHGTKAYYFDFEPFHPEYLLVPSGLAEKGWEICKSYGALAIANKYTKMCCSNSGRCPLRGKQPNCPCPGSILVFPKEYIEL